jgi:hypothetical protein
MAERSMARKRVPSPKASQLAGFKYFALITPFLMRLHELGCDRDKAGNRELVADQYVALLLLYYFSPILTSLRGLQQASGLDKVQKQLGVRRVSLGALSEASGVFDPEALREIVVELAQMAAPILLPKEAAALKDLVAVDGSLLPALPRMTWALWQDEQHRAAKLHLHFAVARGVPCQATVTPGNESEIEQLRETLEAGRLYVLDRGDAAYRLLANILKAKSSFIVRLQERAVYTVAVERPLTAAGRSGGVVRDLQISRLGTEKHPDEIGRPLRIVIVATGKRQADGSAEELVLCTDRLDLDADLVALGYKYRWSVELYFRWLKCILGCRHLVGESQAGVQIQAYVALIASLLIVLWVQRKPTKRTFEMLCFYFMGWATEEEMQAHIDHLDPAPANSS